MGLSEVELTWVTNYHDYQWKSTSHAYGYTKVWPFLVWYYHNSQGQDGRDLIATIHTSAFISGYEQVVKEQRNLITYPPKSGKSAKSSHKLNN